MKVRYAEIDDLNRWNDLLVDNPDGGNVFQSLEMAEAKRQNGWQPKYIVVNGKAVTLLEKHIWLLGKFWYLPKGPGVTTVDELTEFLTPLSDFAKAEGVFVFKIEPEIIETNSNLEAIKNLGLIKVSPIQPNHSTVIIDLSPLPKDVMASFNQKGRHALHRAERDGVLAYEAPLNKTTVETMYRLLAETASGRFDSSLRKFSYYETFWQNFIKTKHGSIFFAEFEGEIVASAFCVYIGKKGLYKDGASLRKKTTYGASHLLQWEVMKWMKERGVTSYDLCGSPHSSQINDTTNPFYGIGRFKTSFNKTVTDYVGCYDVVINPKAYNIWQRFAERLIISLTWRIKHRQWY